MTADPAGIDALTRQIRACFNRLKALGDALHADLGITAAMRAVIEHLHETGRQTVPQIARAKGVSRQHIQMLINALAAAALVETSDNPADRRSPHVALTREGKTAFRQIRRREANLLAAAAVALAGSDLAAAQASLDALRRWLDETIAALPRAD